MVLQLIDALNEGLHANIFLTLMPNHVILHLALVKLKQFHDATYGLVVERVILPLNPSNWLIYHDFCQHFKEAHKFIQRFLCLSGVGLLVSPSLLILMSYRSIGRGQRPIRLFVT